MIYASKCSGLPDGVTVAQQTLDLFVMVQIHVGQPTAIFDFRLTICDLHCRSLISPFSANGAFRQCNGYAPGLYRASWRPCFSERIPKASRESRSREVSAGAPFATPS